MLVPLYEAYCVSMQVACCRGWVSSENFKCFFLLSHFFFFWKNLGSSKFYWRGSHVQWIPWLLLGVMKRCFRFLPKNVLQWQGKVFGSECRCHRPWLVVIAFCTWSQPEAQVVELSGLGAGVWTLSPALRMFWWGFTEVLRFMHGRSFEFLGPPMRDP